MSVRKQSQLTEAPSCSNTTNKIIIMLKSSRNHVHRVFYLQFRVQQVNFCSHTIHSFFTVKLLSLA